MRDEEGNVRTVRQALIRGRDPSTAAGAGCGCSVPGETERGRGGMLAAAGIGLLGLVLLRRRRSRGGLAVSALGLVAAATQGCSSCGDEAHGEIAGCGSDCKQACTTGLGRGQPGAYLSIAKANDGSIWAAGYNDALLEDDNALLWGDLVVGKVDRAKNDVAWEVVDGIPPRTAGTCPQYEPDGWRRGETDPGDNVGRYASIQVTAAGTPIVSYYDDTNRRLKLATFDGSWKVSVLREQPGADVGRYGRMILDGDRPVIAFLQLEPGAAGRRRSKVVLARARLPSPRGAEDFTFEDVAVDEDGEPGGGAAETHPRVLGPYLDLARGPQGLGIVAYDGRHGDLVGLVDRGRVPWERVVLDDGADVGIAASLAIGPTGTWHVGYVDGVAETLRYLEVVDGRTTRREIVDDGAAPDGKHIVGDDAAIRVSGDTVTITYADSTALGLRRATRLLTADAWQVRTVADTAPVPRWLLFPQPVPGEDAIAAFWRRTSREDRMVEGSVTLLGP